MWLRSASPHDLPDLCSCEKKRDAPHPRVVAVPWCWLQQQSSSRHLAPCVWLWGATLSRSFWLGWSAGGGVALYGEPRAVGAGHDQQVHRNGQEAQGPPSSLMPLAPSLSPNRSSAAPSFTPPCLTRAMACGHAPHGGEEREERGHKRAVWEAERGRGCIAAGVGAERENSEGSDVVGAAVDCRRSELGP